MATVRHSKKAAAVKRKPVIRVLPRKERIVLPTEYAEPGGDFNDFAILLHGEKKIGKTTLSLRGEGKVLLLQCDPPQRAYRRIELLIRAWKDYLGIMDSLERAATHGKFPYSRVVTDGVDSLYQMCLRHVCAERGIAHPEDESYGKGWSGVRTEFTDGIGRFLSLPCGRWFLAHSQWKSVKDRVSGEEVEKLVPKLSAQAEEIINGQVDAWFAYDYVGDQRSIFLRGSETIGAGHRMDSDRAFPRFRCSGKPLKRISAGSSADEAYRNLLAAFNNKYVPKRST